GQGFFGEGAGLQAQLSAEAFHVEHGADFLDLVARRQRPEGHGRDAQYLVAGWVAQRRPLDGADQGAPGHYLVTFGDAVLDHDLQIRHGVANGLNQLDEARTVERAANERTLVDKVAAMQLFGQGHTTLVPG